jgi:flavin reductase (DIM6/NTAB) family NADH-FMN oxidoreductase RutF
MLFDLAQIAPMERYELLLGTVVPRPIALITSLSADGTVNAAPYSLFNVMSHDPPIVAFSVLPDPAGRMKHTGRNILATQEFVVNLVSEAIAEAMNLACIDAPADVSEIDLVGLKTAPSTSVKPPKIQDSPVSLECRFVSSVEFGPNQTVIFGRVEHVHVPDDLVLDGPNCIIDTPKLKLIGAMHAAKFYSRTADVLEMIRPNWAEWSAKNRR